MKGLLSRLLDLTSIDWSDPSVSFGFERPLPAWAWAAVFLFAAGVALWSYSRLTGRAWVRSGLGVVRALLLLLLVALLCGPQLVKRNELNENDWALILVDRSASLAVRDAPGAGGAAGGERTSREQQLEAALAKSRPMWEKLAKDRTVLWLGFDAGLHDLKVEKEGPSLGAPEGRRTAIGAALEEALARAAARPVAGVVVISDGRSIDEPTRNALRRLQGEKVPVVCVPLGSATPVGDLAVRRVDGPRVAFLNDPSQVRVEVERIGAGESGGPARVRLLDKSTGRVLDEKLVEFGAPEGDAKGTVRTGVVTLSGKGDLAGPAQWVVEVSPQAGADLVSANNTSELSVELIDRPLRVLFVDGYPRWEQRYLKNLLVREKSISCSTLILSPDKKFMQEGDVELDALPDSPERWAEFDAVILGDVRPDVFTKDQLAQLKEHVAQRGGGLIWVAGPSSTPLAWYGTALADLLPFSKDAADGTTLAAPVLMQPSPEAFRLGVLRLGGALDADPWPAALSTFETGWAQLRWAQRIEPSLVKPTAETLATVRFETAGAADREHRPFPLLLQMKYGAGRVIYCATDEVWRWRYGRGETLYERFWTPLVRLLGRDALSRSGRSVLVEASPSRAVVDQPVRVAVELLDQSLLDLSLGSVTVRVTSKADQTQAGSELTLRPEAPAAAGAGPVNPGSGSSARVYSAVWVPTEAGQYTAEVAESVFAGRVPKTQLSAGVQVSLPDDELRTPEADHALLARLAKETEGVVIAPENLSDLPSHLPNRKVRVVTEDTEALWDTPLALLLSVLLLTLEWVGRRVIRLA